MDEMKQVDKSHYAFEQYMTMMRWTSVWHQVNEISRLKPKNVLEIGPGPGVFKKVAGAFGISVETLDLDPELSPDHVGSATALPFEDNTYDVVCAFQMLEHLEFEKSLIAFREMARVAERNIVISLPDCRVRWPTTITLPRIGALKLFIPKPRLRAPRHQFDGEHFWEIGKSGYSLSYVIDELVSAGTVDLEYSFRIHENPYHRFFLFNKKKL